jgi:N-acetylglucosamine-6-phosphate deacetylase
MTTVVHSARQVDDGRINDDAWVRFDGERVVENG